MRFVLHADRMIDITPLQIASPRWRVVVLDDDDRSRTVLGAAILRAGGRTTAESTRCPGALELVQRAKADVAIVASDLPEGDAIAVAAETTSVACCPVVLVGREATPSLVARALEAGVMGFLLKPFRRGQLAPTLDLAVARFHETQRLKRALEDRKVIERAKGRLMDREALGEEEAFRRLRTTAMNTRRPLVEVALDVLAAEGARAPVTPPRVAAEPGRAFKRYAPGRGHGIVWPRAAATGLPTLPPSARLGQRARSL
jgi:AmiR/NasT family two-component response regulator